MRKNTWRDPIGSQKAILSVTKGRKISPTTKSRARTQNIVYQYIVTCQIRWTPHLSIIALIENSTQSTTEMTIIPPLISSLNISSYHKNFDVQIYSFINNHKYIFFEENIITNFFFEENIITILRHRLINNRKSQ